MIELIGEISVFTQMLLTSGVAAVLGVFWVTVGAVMALAFIVAGVFDLRQ